MIIQYIVDWKRSSLLPAFVEVFQDKNWHMICYITL